MILSKFFSSSPHARPTQYELLDGPSLPEPTGHRGQGHTRTRSSSYHRARLRSSALVATLAAIPFVLFAAGLLVYHFVFRIYLVDEFVYGYPDVPDYDEYYTWEDRLPQHNASLPFPEGPSGRYVMFSNQAWGYGLNNQLQEIILLSHISHLSERSYVFQPYTWDAKAKSNAVLDGRSWRSSRIPLNVFISGPTAGGSFSHGDSSPRAVNLRWWEQVCPPEKRTILDVTDQHKLWGVTVETQGSELLEQWSALLKGMEDSCVEVNGPTIFDFTLIASPRVLSIWPTLSNSPILTRFTWSSLIKAAVARNLPLFLSDLNQPSHDEPPRLPDEIRSIPDEEEVKSPRSEQAHPQAPSPRGPPGQNRRPPSPSFSSFSLQTSDLTHGSSTTNITNAPLIKGLVAVHLRRGDFKMHCHWLADRTEPFAGWNQFDYLLDRFTPPEAAYGPLGRGQIHNLYVDRCWPEIDQIVRRLREVRRLHPGLESVFVLTNGKKDWVDKLKHALLQDENKSSPPSNEPQLPDAHEPPPMLPGAVRVQPLPPSTSDKGAWKAVYTSKDLHLLWTEREIDQAVDMEIARRAEVFLGNGFSSLTSNIVMLRLSDHSPIENIRFW